MKATDKDRAKEKQPEDTDPPIRLPLLNTAAETRERRAERRLTEATAGAHV